MKVSTLLSYLIGSELANLSVAKTSVPENLQKVFGYINRGLAEINKEFSLNQEEAIVVLKPGRVRYYVQDDKLIKILGGFNSEGEELTLNDEDDKDNTLFIPEYNVVEYYGENKATDTVEDFLSVIYLKGFAEVTTELDSIRINEGMVECLTAYIGYLAHTALNKNSINASNSYYQKYLKALETIKELNIVPESLYQNTNLDDRGFV